MMKTGHLFAVATLLALGAAAAQEQPNTQMTPEEIQAKMDWVNEVEAQDFQFWRRWRDQPDQQAFRQPQTWYNPMILVDGGVSQPFFPSAGPDEPATIDPEAIAAASRYAMERETQAFMIYHKGKIRHAEFMEGFHESSPISSHSWVKTLHGIVAGFALAGALPAATVAAAAAGVQEPPADAQALENPVEATRESLAAGRQRYVFLCRQCHGNRGAGDGDMSHAGGIPSDFTDDVWTHGASDGEIFTVIKEGVSADMQGYGNQLRDEDIWNLVNYIKSLSR